MITGNNNSKNQISIRDLADDVQRLKEWLAVNPTLPPVADDEWLETLLHSHEYNLERTKCKMRAYYSLRIKHPAILQNRDPTSPELQQVRWMLNMSVSERLTEDGDRMLYYVFAADSSRFNAVDYFKRCIMVFDMLLLEKDRASGYIIVTDCKKVTYKHIFKLMKVMSAGAEIFNEAYTERIKAIHLINASGFIKKAVDLVIGYFPCYADIISIHTASNNQILQHVDEKYLPEDFGGRGPSIEKCDEYTQQKLEQHRGWYMEQDILTSSMKANSVKKKRGWKLWG